MTLGRRARPATADLTALTARVAALEAIVAELSQPTTDRLITFSGGGKGGAASVLHVLDSSTGAELRSWPLPTGLNANGVQVAGGRIAVTAAPIKQKSSTLLIYDGNTGAQLASSSIDSRAHVRLNAGGTQLFVASGNTLTVLDAATLATLSTLTFPDTDVTQSFGVINVTSDNHVVAMMYIVDNTTLVNSYVIVLIDPVTGTTTVLGETDDTDPLDVSEIPVSGTNVYFVNATDGLLHIVDSVSGFQQSADLGLGTFGQNGIMAFPSVDGTQVLILGTGFDPATFQSFLTVKNVSIEGNGGKKGSKIIVSDVAQIPDDYADWGAAAAGSDKVWYAGSLGTSLIDRTTGAPTLLAPTDSPIAAGKLK